MAGPPAVRNAVPAMVWQENRPPKGASTPEGVGCRIGRGYSVFARKGKPRDGSILPFLRHSGLDPGSIAAAASLTPDQVRGDEGAKAALAQPCLRCHTFAIPE